MVNHVVEAATDRIGRASEAEHADEGLVARRRHAVGIDRVKGFRSRFEQEPSERLAVGAPCFARLQPLPGCAACGDVDGRAEGTDADVVGEQPAAFCGDPADDAVFFSDRPIFNVVGRADRGIERRGKRRRRDSVVVGMQSGVEVRHGERPARRNAEHRPEPVGHRQHVGDGVEVPRADLARVGREAQRFLAQR